MFMNLYIKLSLAICMLMFATSVSVGQDSKRTTVAILLFEDVQIIDFTGPWETFGQAGFKIFTVSEEKDTIHASMGMKLFADYTLSESPDADILVVPGGGIPHDLPSDHPMVMWLKQKEKNATYILTVCNGAFILGPADFSKGLSITTNAGMINHLSAFAAGCIPVYDKRFVHDGKFISAGGLTAGIDASLYLISQINSNGRAQEVANKMEYDWDPSGEYVRTKLADFELSKALDFNPPLRKKVLKYEGDEIYWLADFVVKRTETLEAFAKQMEDAAESENWKIISESKKENLIEYEWTYSNHRSENWKLNASFSATEIQNEYRLIINLSRE